MWTRSVSTLLLSPLLVEPGLVKAFSTGGDGRGTVRNLLATESVDNTADSRRSFLEWFGAGAVASAAFVTGSTFLPTNAAAAAAYADNDISATAMTPPLAKVGGRIVYGDESLMSQKGHGTSAVPVQDELRYGVSRKLADKICNFNRHFAEMGGYFESTIFEDVMRQSTGPVTFYDSNTGRALFVAPVGRSVEDFIAESEVHGWPSFRDTEVVWDNVRVLRNSGETVSIDGTHLGHNLPDRKGNRYCINLVSIAGSPSKQA